MIPYCEKCIYVFPIVPTMSYCIAFFFFNLVSNEALCIAFVCVAFASFNLEQSTDFFCLFFTSLFAESYRMFYIFNLSTVKILKCYKAN